MFKKYIVLLILSHFIYSQEFKGTLHCPYCGDHVERKYFIAHLQGCERLSTYIFTSPSRQKDHNSSGKNNADNNQQHNNNSSATSTTDGRFESKPKCNCLTGGASVFRDVRYGRGGCRLWHTIHIDGRARRIFE